MPQYNYRSSAPPSYKPIYGNTFTDIIGGVQKAGDKIGKFMLEQDKKKDFNSLSEANNVLTQIANNSLTREEFMSKTEGLADTYSNGKRELFNKIKGAIQGTASKFETQAKYNRRVKKEEAYIRKQDAMVAKYAKELEIKEAREIQDQKNWEKNYAFKVKKLKQSGSNKGVTRNKTLVDNQIAIELSNNLAEDKINGTSTGTNFIKDTEKLESRYLDAGFSQAQAELYASSAKKKGLDLSLRVDTKTAKRVIDNTKRINKSEISNLTKEYDGRQSLLDKFNKQISKKLTRRKDLDTPEYAKIEEAKEGSKNLLMTQDYVNALKRQFSTLDKLAKEISVDKNGNNYASTEFNTKFSKTLKTYFNLTEKGFVKGIKFGDVINTVKQYKGERDAIQQEMKVLAKEKGVELSPSNYEQVYELFINNMSTTDGKLYKAYRELGGVINDMTILSGKPNAKKLALLDLFLLFD